MNEESTNSRHVPNEKQPNPYPHTESFAASRAGFYRIRTKIYTGLLISIVVLGLPIVSVPGLRQRLGERTLAIRQAMYGPMPRLVSLKVGENKEPFPEEYKASNAVQIPEPKFAPVQLMPAPSSPTSPRISSKIIKAETGMTTANAPATVDEPASINESDQPRAESEPKFQQGSVEKEAYELLLKENSSISDMVSGKNPSLQFKSWSAAKRQVEGTYLVDLAFTRLADNQEEHFIWQVNLATKQITPMSFNARGLPR
jgi:hypothetical protein